MTSMRSLLDRWVPWDADRAAALVAVRITYWPFRELLGVYLQHDDATDEIALRESLADPDQSRLRRQVIAHELGHRALHRGEHMGVVHCDTDVVITNRAELHAERWAGIQLCPPAIILMFFERMGTVGPHEIAELADRCGVMPQWLTWWVGDLLGRGVIREEFGRDLHQDWVPHRPNGRFSEEAERRAARVRAYGYDPEQEADA